MNIGMKHHQDSDVKRQGQKILVVDDYHDAADTTADLFRISGKYEVKTAYDGKEAVELSRSFRPAVVVLDINMPVMDGYQVARLLRDEQDPATKLLLVAMTGRTQADDMERAAAAGFDHHFSKPLMDRALFDFVASFFNETLGRDKP